jgi:arginyl-tRNA synthetase
MAIDVLEPALAFRSFFEACRVFKVEGSIRSRGLVLCGLVSRTFKQGITLLGSQVPDRL